MLIMENISKTSKNLASLQKTIRISFKKEIVFFLSTSTFVSHKKLLSYMLQESKEEKKHKRK